MSLNAKIRELALLRAKRDAAEKILQSVQFDVNAIKNEYDKLEEEIRQEALKYHAETGDMQPHPAIKIRKQPKYSFDYDAAFSIAQNRSGAGLKIKKDSAPDVVKQMIETYGDESKDLFEVDPVALKSLFREKPDVYRPAVTEEIEYITAMQTKLGEYLLFDNASEE